MLESDDAQIEETPTEEWYKSIQGKSDKILQKNYKELKIFGMELEELNKIAIKCKSFNNKDVEFVSKFPESSLKIGQFWKRLMRKGDEMCFAFIKELTMNGKNDFVKVINRNLDPPTCSPIVQSINKSHIRDQRNNISQEMSLSRGVLDLLFMQFIITIDEHDRIEELPERDQQRNEILEILLNKPDSAWISGFLQVLSLTGHHRIIRKLRDLQAGSTGSTVPFRNFAIRLNGSRRNEAGFRAVASKWSAMEIFQEFVDADIVELRETCICIHLTTDSPNALLDIIEGRWKDKMKSFIQDLFHKNRHLIQYFTNATVIEVLIRELPNHGFITDGNDIPCPEGFCPECYQKTIQRNYKKVLDEIEDDIIDDTLKRVDKMRTAQNRLQNGKECFMEIDSRQKKAVHFLQYVLCNKDVLIAFKEAFNASSRVLLMTQLCSDCFKKGDTYTEMGIRPKEIEFYFKVKLTKSGRVEVNEASKEQYKTSEK